MRTHWDVIVVGAGLAGLAAGATAAAGGAETVVLEAHQPGGRARTVSKGPYVFTMGPHALYLGGPSTKVLRLLGIEPDGEPSPFPRKFTLLKDGQIHPVPAGRTGLLRTTLMSRAAAAHYRRLLEALPTLDPARLAGTTVREWLEDHNLGVDASAVIRALIRLSTFTADIEEFSAGAAVHQLQIGGREGVLYLHGGWTQLVDGLAAQVRVQKRAKVTRVEPAGGRVEVWAGDEVLTARQVIVATGTPAATRAVLPAEPGWAGLGPPLTGACLGIGLTRVPEPGYLIGVDEPIMGSTQSPPAGQQCPGGHAVVHAIRYTATGAGADRLALDAHVARLGVLDSDIAQSRFLARMVVAGSTPGASAGGLAGRPRVTDSGHAGVLIAGDWVGPEGLLTDASLASGHEAALHALRALEHRPVMVG